MSFMPVTAAVLMTFAGATAALAQDAAAPAPVPNAKPAKVRKVCREDVATGSIMPHSTCHTKDEWAAIDAANEAQVNQQLGHRNGMSTPGH